LQRNVYSLFSASTYTERGKGGTQKVSTRGEKRRGSVKPKKRVGGKGIRGKREKTHLDGGDTSTLLGNTVGATLAGSLVLDAASLGLVSEDLGAVGLGLGLVDVVHENALKGGKRT
jgi:hypothetical protein